MAKNKENKAEFAFKGMVRKEAEPIELSRKNIHGGQIWREKSLSHAESLFIVPWQQLEK